MSHDPEKRAASSVDATPETAGQAGALALAAGSPPLHAADKSVRELTVTAKLVAGDVRVECRRAGIVFGFPRAVWPADLWAQAQWVERLTPWWDMSEPDWTPQAARLRDSCRAAINKLSAHTQNLVATPTANAQQGAPERGRSRSANRKAAGECVCADSTSAANR